MSLMPVDGANWVAALVSLRRPLRWQLVNERTGDVLWRSRRKREVELMRRALLHSTTAGIGVNWLAVRRCPSTTLP